MDGISLKGFAEFARIKSEAESQFDYNDISDCAFAQYLKSLDYENPLVGGDRYWLVREYVNQDNAIYLCDLHPELGIEIARAKDDWSALADRLGTLVRGY